MGCEDFGKFINISELKKKENKSSFVHGYDSIKIFSLLGTVRIKEDKKREVIEVFEDDFNFKVGTKFKAVKSCKGVNPDEVIVNYLYLIFFS